MDRDLRIRMLIEAMDKFTGPAKAIAGGSTRLGQAMKAAREEMAKLKRAQNDIASFRRLKGEVQANETAMQAAESRVAALARQMAAADNPTRKLTAEFNKARREAGALKTQHGENANRLQQLRDSLSAAGISTRNLAEHERQLRSNMARTNAEIDEQKRKLSDLNARNQRFADGRAAFGKVQGMSTGLAVGGATSMGAGVAMGAPIFGAYKQAREFESAMTDIAQKADLGRGAARQMGLELIKAATAANQFPQAMQQGVDTLAGFGLDPRQATQMMAPIGRAATAYKAEIADLATAGFAAVDNLKVPIGETARALDMMAQAGKSGAFEIRDMAQYFPALTAASQALGQQGVAAVGDLAAALQITRKGAGDSATAANNLQNLLNKIQSKDTVANFKKFGVDLPAALKKAAKDGKSPIEAITELTNKALGGDLGKLSYLFGDAQVQAALRPLIQNFEEFKKIRADALGAKGVVDRDFTERMRDGAEQAKALEIGSQQLALTLGSILLPTINQIMGKATAVARRFSAWANENPKLAKGVAWIAGGLAAAMIVFGGLAIAISGVLAPFAALAFIAGLLGIGLLPLIGTVAAVVAGITLLGMAAYWIYKNWDGIVAWFGNLWRGITSTVMGGVAWLQSLPARFVQFGRDLINGLISGITGKLGELKNTIVSAAGKAAQWFREKLGIHSPSRVFAGIGGFVTEGLAQGIAQGTPEPIDRIKTLAGRLATAMAIGAAAPAVAASGGQGAGVPAANAAASAGMGGNTYNITINASGADGQDIARQVREEIERLERERAGRTFGDD